MCTEAYTDHRKVASFWALLCTPQRVRRADPDEARQPKSAESLKCTACTPQASEEKSDGRDSIHGATGAGVARTNRADSGPEELPHASWSTQCSPSASAESAALGRTAPSPNRISIERLIR